MAGLGMLSKTWKVLVRKLLLTEGYWLLSLCRAGSLKTQESSNIAFTIPLYPNMTGNERFMRVAYDWPSHVEQSKGSPSTLSIVATERHIFTS